MADLHVHTPASSDMAERWKTATPADVVRIAIEKGLDLIAVTDHNTAGWCDPVREAAQGTTLTVLPGVEISTSQGHLLALFDVTTPASQIEDLLISLEIPRDQFGSLDAATQKGIVDVCVSVEKAGGVAIAAHIDGERGFLKMIKVGAERHRAYAAPDLRALEILDPSLRDGYQSGTVTGYPRRMPCVQSSDCWPKGADRHELDGMAYRCSRLKMDDRSLSGLKLALIDPEIRVRLAVDESPSPSLAIMGMWVTGGFLNGQQVRFSENVNCLIGDTGAGKSVAIELVRFGLDQQSGVKKIQQEVESLLKQQLGNLGTVHILVRKSETQYLVERAWGSPPGPPLVRRVTPTDLEPVEGELDMRLFFPIKGFSQSEIIEFAREPEVRLSLTDDLIDCTAELAAISDLKVSLRKNAATISAEQGKEANILAQLTELPTLVEARKEIDKVLTDERITQHQQWYREQTLLSQADSQLGSLGDKLETAISSLRLTPSWPEEGDVLPNPDLMGELKGIYREWQEHVTAIEEGTKEKLNGLVERLGGLRGRWDTRFGKAEEVYRQLLESIDKDGIGLQALSQRRQTIEEQISVLEGRRHELESDVLPRIRELQKEREELLTSLQDNRKAITGKREGKAKELSERLDHKIRLNVHARANTSEFRGELQEIARGSFLHGSDLDLLAAKFHPVPLVKQLLSQDFESLFNQSGVESTKLAKMWDTVLERERLSDLYELQLTDVEDVIEVMLQVEKGTYRRLEDLSHGQKCMVVLMVALAEGHFPLLVDQPEDALHAPSIEEGIVSTLRSQRGTRQCIFATRNANILVSADAEQIIALKADANHGEVAGTGSLDRFDHRQLVIYHVEGGDEAFRLKQTIYTLRPVP